NVKQITDNLISNNSQTFVYDYLNRLTSAQATVYGTITYAYNEIGNMTSNSQIGNYTYPTNGIRPHAVTQAGATVYGYDNNGNMTTGAGRTIAYDYENRPTSITISGQTTTFVYDGDGGRVKKIGGGLTMTYIGKLYECVTGGSGTTCKKYIYAGSERVAMVPVAGSAGEVYYFHGDHLSSTSVITDKCGNKVLETRYFPYGSKRVENSYSGCTSLDNRIRHFFTGQELDGETGLYFYGARYYDPVLGRFIQPDSLVPNPRDPQDLNRYTYAGNNPLKYTDPTGHGKFWKKVAGYALVAVGVVVAAVTTVVAVGSAGTCSAGCYALYSVAITMMSSGVALVNDRPPSISATLSCSTQSCTA
ncbi:MAG: RHS repeat-associated core domain-containing protein, partial [Nitrospira sp.]|nr:RHS repeat-associated core domain-containing protein [Nitrospira sp.]